MLWSKKQPSEGDLSLLMPPRGLDALERSDRLWPSDMKTQPCKTCPWRKASTVGGSDIPNFNLDMMRNLSCTVGPEDDFRSIMACHYSDEGAETPCIGYIAVEGMSNLNVRLMAIQGRLPLRQIMIDCVGIELWEAFDTMMEAYEEANDGA